MGVNGHGRYCGIDAAASAYLRNPPQFHQGACYICAPTGAGRDGGSISSLERAKSVKSMENIHTDVELPAQTRSKQWGQQEFEERFVLFERGEWLTLLGQARGTHAELRRTRSARQFSIEERLDRAVRRVKGKQVSRARNKLCSQPLAPQAPWLQGTHCRIPQDDHRFKVNLTGMRSRSSTCTLRCSLTANSLPTPCAPHPRGRPVPFPARATNFSD